jgi:hypothetical protein
MFSGAASKSLFEKGRRADEPGAKGMGIDSATENSPRTQHRGFSMASSLGKNHGTFAVPKAGSVPGRGAGSLPGIDRKNSSRLPRLGRNELIRETQSIVLQFPIKDMAEMQDATTKAVESQRNGDSAMSLLAAANCSRSNVRARAMFARLFGFTGHHTDPDFMEGLEKMALGYMRQQMAAMGMAPETCADDACAVNNSEIASEDSDALTGDLFEFAGRA